MANTSHQMELTTDEIFMIIAARTPDSFHYSAGVVLLLGNVGSVITNGSVLFIFFVIDRKQLNRTNLYIAAICLLSLLMAVFATPMVAVSSFNKFWLFGEVACKYYAFMMSFAGFSVMLILGMISIDRYIHVVKSSLAIHFSSTLSLVLILISILTSLAFAIFPLVGWNQYIYEGVGTTCAIDLIGDEYNGRSYVLALLIVFFAVPVSVMIFSYGSVYAKVMKESKAHLRSVRRSESVSSSEEIMKKWSLEKELAVTVTLIIGAFLLCWSPYSFLLLWKLLYKNATIHPILMAVPAMIAKTAGLFTPAVYLYRNREFRKQVLRLYPCSRKGNAVVPSNLDVNNTMMMSLKSDNSIVFPRENELGNPQPGTVSDIEMNIPKTRLKIQKSLVKANLKLSSSTFKGVGKTSALDIGKKMDDAEHEKKIPCTSKAESKKKLKFSSEKQLD